MEAPRPCLLGLLLALLPCCCLLPRAAPQSSQPAADEAQLLLQIKREWGDPPVLAGGPTPAMAVAVAAAVDPAPSRPLLLLLCDM